MGEKIESFKLIKEIDLSKIEGYPVSFVEGHVNKMLIGLYKDVPVLILKGRVHFYEGYTMNEIVFSVRIAGLIGVKTMILTNLAGGINTDYRTGDFMLIEDHISLFVPNCLYGKNDSRLGERFPDMTQVYNKKYIDKIMLEGSKYGIKVHKGIYVQLPGPSFETPAEIRMLRMLGSDAVGMSTVCEAIACRHMKMNVCGISCISNMASGINQELQSFDDIKEIGKTVSEKLWKLIGLVIDED